MRCHFRCKPRRLAFQRLKMAMTQNQPLSLTVKSRPPYTLHWPTRHERIPSSATRLTPAVLISTLVCAAMALSSGILIEATTTPGGLLSLSPSLLVTSRSTSASNLTRSRPATAHERFVAAWAARYRAVSDPRYPVAPYRIRSYGRAAAEVLTVSEADVVAGMADVLDC